MDISSPNLVNFDSGVRRCHAAACISPSLMHWFYVIVRVFFISDEWLFMLFNLVISLFSLSLLYILVVVISWFSFCFLSSSQEIGWEEHPRNDQFCLEWDVTP